MAAKLTSLTHKIAIQLRLVAPGGQSGNFWIYPHTISSRRLPVCDSIM